MEATYVHLQKCEIFFIVAITHLKLKQVTFHYYDVGELFFFFFFYPKQ